MQIENEQVKQLYEDWKSIYWDVGLDKTERIHALNIMKVIQAVAVVYEQNDILTEDEYGDLFINWEVGKQEPVYPEDVPGLMKRVDKMMEQFK